MSSPYRYTPQLYPPSNPYVDAYFNQKQPSPFIPNASLYPPTPYTSTSAPNTPNLLFKEDFAFPEGFQRTRRPSWHADQIPAFMPNHSTYLSAPEPANFHSRRHSFGNTPYSTPWMNNHSSSSLSQPYAPWLYPPQPPTFQIHPFLNGQSLRPDFHFDLSFPKFYPVRWVGPDQVLPLTVEQLQEPATHPSITRLRIACDITPQWPIDLEYNPYSQGGGLHIPTPPVPISLGDILVALHRSLHMRISHIDWAKLSVSEETAVSRAYTRRCKSIPSLSQYEASQGVRRVDYLLDKVMFRGLVRVSGGTEGFETMKLIVG